MRHKSISTTILLFQAVAIWLVGPGGVGGVDGHSEGTTRSPHRKDTDAYEALYRDISTNYNRMLRPGFGEKPAQVQVSIYVSSLRSISEQTMDYKLELYYREYWLDERLTFDPTSFNMSTITLHESFVSLLWVPDTFLPNAISSDNPDPNSISHRSLLRLDSKGNLLISRRLSVVAECPMDLSLYPFDQQVCRISIESYGHSIDDVIYEWKKENGKIMVDINPNLELPSFKVQGFKTVSRNIALSTGNYSRLELCFIFRRSAGFYFVQLFIPATAIVITSWCALWMEKESTFSDMIEVILAITFLYYSYNTVMPKVSYIKAMDIYLGACFIFVFLSLVKLACLKLLKESLFGDDEFVRETAWVFADASNSNLTQARRASEVCECDGMVSKSNGHGVNNNNGVMPMRDLRPLSRKWKLRVKMLKVIKKSSYFMFPCMFFTLMIIYFICLFTLTSDRETGVCEFE